MGQVVRVFVLGGTGVIGAAVVRELVERGHEVFGLARSDTSAAKLRQWRATPIAGDIEFPEPWAGKLPQFDAVIHAACDFDTDMGAIDRRLLDALLPALAAQRRTSRASIYTGGCWLFGATGDEVATEANAVPSPARLRLDGAAAAARSGGTRHRRRRRSIPPWSTQAMAASSIALPAKRRRARCDRAWWKARPCAGRWCTARTSQASTRWRSKRAPGRIELHRGRHRRASGRPHRARLRKALRYREAWSRGSSRSTPSQPSSANGRGAMRSTSG